MDSGEILSSNRWRGRQRNQDSDTGDVLVAVISW